MTLDVLTAMAAALVLVTLCTAPAGLRLMGRVFLFGLGVLAGQLLLIQAVPAVGAWLAGVAR